MRSEDKLIAMVISLIVGYMVFLTIITWPGLHPKQSFHQVTFYRATGNLTANGEVYNEKLYTCAVKNRDEMNQWLLVTYAGKTVRVWANDMMPQSAKADFDLTPRAFNDLADLSVGRLHGVIVRRDQ